ncbi:hypothetical protein [Jiangella alkaliphila]|nr:hypothetical protein [Jiangella alkaliphila]
MLDDVADDTIAVPRDSMYQEGKGTWYNGTLIVSDGGKLDATFDYDSRPFEGMAGDPSNDGSASREHLLEDHRTPPRCGAPASVASGTSGST